MNKWLVLLLSIVVVRETRSWGGDGHRIVAKIASQFLKQSTKFFLWEILENPGGIAKLDRAMIEESIWADTVAWSEELHFVHTPYRNCAEFDFARDCGFDGSGRCAVSAIANYTMRAIDISRPKQERAEAVRFLIHFMADIHNPMHTGFAKDFGGNSIFVSLPGKTESTTLHEVWDSDLISVAEDTIAQATGKDIDPWTLSVNLLESMLDRESVAEHVLDLKASVNMASEADVLEVVSAIASEVSLRYTCPAAYQHAEGGFVESGDTLSDLYMTMRSQVAMELLKKAGVRLAEFLNTMASAVRFREHQAELRQTGTETRGNSDINFSNQFIVLSMDFDADALLYSPDEPTEIQEEEIQEIATTTRTPANLKATAETTTTTTLCPEEKRRLKNKAKREKKKRNAQLVDGVDLEEVALIKSRGRYIVTSKEFAKIKGYFPDSADMFKVAFSGNEDSRPISFIFDASFFGSQVYSANLVAGALAKIRKLPSTADLLSANILENQEGDESLYFQRVEHVFHELNDAVEIGEGVHAICTKGDLTTAALGKELFGIGMGEDEKKKAKKKADRERRKTNKKLRATYGGELPPASQIARDRVLSLREEIRGYAHESGLLLFVLESTLKKGRMNPILACMHRVHDEDMSNMYYLIVDHEIFEGPTTVEINDLLVTFLKDNKRASRLALKYRPTIYEEIEDLWTVHFSADPDRHQKMKHIRVHHSKPGDEDHSYYRWYWSTNPKDDPFLPKQLGF